MKKYGWLVVLAILVFLAVPSGLTKVMLMPQDVEFFGRYGFTNSLLIGYGALQILGGVLMILRKTRLIGAAIVAVTFLISLVVLLLEGNILISIVTAIAIALLVAIMKQTSTSAAVA